MSTCLGLYKPGRFVSSSISGEPFEGALMMPSGVGRGDESSFAFGTTYGGIAKTTRLVVLLHESSHYLHDLCLGTPLALDYLADTSSAAFFDLLRQLTSTGREIRAPLLASSGSSQIGEYLREPELAPAARVVADCERVTSDIWGHPHTLAAYSVQHPCLRPSADAVSRLSGESLCEGLVATKTVENLHHKIANGDDMAYLERCKRQLPLLPSTLPPLYSVAREVFDSVIGTRLDPTGRPLDQIWPTSYANSSRHLSDIGFTYVCDIALHIPPLWFSEQRVADGRNMYEDFLPAYRFCKALVSLQRRGGFPPDDTSRSPEFYYEVVFDSFAADPDLRWPTLKETNDAWKYHLATMKATRREAADGYRFRMIVEREKRPSTVVTQDSRLACWDQHVPIFHLTPYGFKQLLPLQGSDTWYLVMDEYPRTPDSRGPWETYPQAHATSAWDSFHDVGVSPWKDMVPTTTGPDGKPDRQFRDSTDYYRALSDDADNMRLFRQEVVYRSVCAGLRDALLHQSSFSCPFASTGCSSRDGKCTNRTRLTDVHTDGCCAIEYLKQERLDHARLVWGR